IVNSFFPKFLPSWLRAILFNFQVSLYKRDKFYFSLDRISCADIYRAGDGVHKVFIEIVKKSSLNLLHPIYILLEKRCIKNAKYIIANSLMIKNQIIEVHDVDPNKVKLIYSGIKLKEVNYEDAFDNLTKEFVIRKYQPILLFVGSGYKRKGVKEFLQIVSRLKTKDFKAFVIGKDKNIDYYQKLAKELNIEHLVIFTGAREDVKDFFTISDIFLLPTHYEPFSNVILEAMNFENAVFTTINNGAGEILDAYFIMNKPKDFSVVSKIDKLLQNKDQLSKVKIMNRAKSKEFSIEKNLSATLKVINEVINRTP
ncbi:uncharacterized protein METZ01_LOCUS279294, partial [marine metagenome]